ncbi:NlpC/P60 family protein [Rubellicoccus peritrichatus]|uniref:NlpC/P60 domain-containing protein n=1 Tax=Rubellicoccus peritrichatus TaxID=3080537 RepID=A0AAQ3QXT6_9BACT|nr:NlpC/P60 family protein [Puniceicoccus sp. CR14]WOO43170.1 hypothetical protein RZN69_08695 [Puniceicoccus sp. CR14]
MKYYFNNPERIEALHSECESWLGTRFAQGLSEKGEGVDCVRFVIAVLNASGVPVSQLGTLPAYSVHEGRHSEHTALLRWLAEDDNAKQHLEHVEDIQAGDLLACKIRRGANHLGIAHDKKTMWHCDMRSGVRHISLMPFKHIYAYRLLNNFDQ